MSSNGGALAFLNQGNAPSASSTTSQSSTSLPAWYTDYTSQILNTAAQFAAQPYQTYSGPRIAAQDGLTEDAYGNATSLTQNASNSTQAAQNLIQQGANQNNPLGTAQPYYGSASNTINSAVSGNNPLGVASPYLQAGTDPTYNTVQNYMNPYNQNVTSAIANAANTNFNNYTLPALQSGIIGSGNITGSSTEGTNLMENAEQQNEQNINNAQAAALQSGYSSSLSAAQAGNQNALTAGSTAGTLNSAGTQNALTAAGQQAALGTAAGNLNSQGVTNALNAGVDTSNVGTQGLSNQIAGENQQNTLGLQNQNYGQSNLNLAYQDYLNQLNYPMTQVSEMQSALSGIQVPSAVQNYQYSTGINGANGSAQTTSPSPLATVLGSGATAAAGNSTTSSNPGTAVPVGTTYYHRGGKARK